MQASSRHQFYTRKWVKEKNNNLLSWCKFSAVPPHCKIKYPMVEATKEKVSPESSQIIFYNKNIRTA